RGALVRLDVVVGDSQHCPLAIRGDRWRPEPRKLPHQLGREWLLLFDLLGTVRQRRSEDEGCQQWDEPRHRSSWERRDRQFTPFPYNARSLAYKSIQTGADAKDPRLYGASQSGGMGHLKMPEPRKLENCTRTPSL